MALYPCYISEGSNVAATGTVTVQNNVRKYVELGFRPSYISLIGWNNDANQGVTCMYNQTIDSSQQYRAFFRASPAASKLPMPSGADYAGAIDGIDDTGFYISGANASWSYSANVFYYTAIA